MGESKLGLATAITLLAVIGLAVIWHQSQVGNQAVEKPVELSNEVENVAFGVIIADVNESARYLYAVDSAIHEVNDYCVANELPLRFSYESKITTEMNNLDWFEGLRQDGVKIFFESPWNSPICSSDNYINVNGLTMIGAPWGNGFCPSHNRVDYIYRVSPNQGENTPALPATLTENGVRALIVIQLDDGTDDRIKRFVDEILSAAAGVEEYRIIEVGFTDAPQEAFIKEDRRNSEALMAEVSSTISELTKTYSMDEVGILYAGLTTNPRHIGAAGNHPDLMNVTWYGTSYLSMDRDLLSPYGNVTSRVHLLSPHPEVSLGDNAVYQRLEAGYEKTAVYQVDEDKLGVAEASLYDAVWVAALSVIRTGSTDAEDIQGVFIDEAGRYSGATGKIILDQNGDRVGVDQLVCGCFMVDGVPQWIPLMRFYAETGEIVPIG